MLQVDLDVVPFLQTERARTLVGAEAEQRLRRDHVPAAGLAARDSLQLAQLFERIDAHVGIRADADPDAALADALDGKEAVAEVCLRGRAGADTCAGVGDQVELGAVCVRRVHDGRPFAQAARAVQQLDRTDAVLLETLFDLARLLVRVDVQRESLSGGIATDLLEPVRRTRADGVGGEPDGDAPTAQVLDLPQVIGGRILAKARQPAAAVRGKQEDDLDPGLGRGLDRRQGLLETEIVELADGRISRGAQFPVDLGVLASHELRCLTLSLGEHQLSPIPEVAAARPAAQGALKRMAMGIDEARQAEVLRHGRILSHQMATRAVPAPLQQLPNALTIARLALIPVFVALMLSAEGGHSWPAGIVFGVAGITDQIDGFLARRWRVESDFGRIFDPLADRLMIDAAVILLFLADHMPWLGLVVILGRDLVLMAGYKAIAPQGYELNVNLLGKTATWLLYAGIAFLLVTHRSTDWPYWIFGIGLVLSLIAGAVYAVTAWRQVRR
jgi:CDP-diacylglycerol--glycerol-3-phosphate 3-phosphatidyltransferase